MMGMDVRIAERSIGMMAFVVWPQLRVHMLTAFGVGSDGQHTHTLVLVVIQSYVQTESYRSFGSLPRPSPFLVLGCASVGAAGALDSGAALSRYRKNCTKTPKSRNNVPSDPTSQLRLTKMYFP